MTTTAAGTFTFTGFFTQAEPVLVSIAAIVTVIGIAYSIWYKHTGRGNK